MLTPDAIEIFERSVLCWLATADKDGAPSVSPKEIFTVRSVDELLIANIASPRSVKNIAERSDVCVAAIDVFEQRGFQVFGSARVVRNGGADFESLAAPLSEIAGPQFPITSVIHVRVESVSQIVAPSTWLNPEVSAEDRRKATLDAYGVRDIVGD